MPQIKILNVTFHLIVHIEIGELEVFLDISLSPFNIALACRANMYMAILTAIDVTLTTCAMQTKGKILANINCCAYVHK